MYRISELAEKVNLSRTTLLYYEKIGLIHGHRLDNGYRTYTEHDLQRLRLILQLQRGGLTLKECKACLDAKINRALLVDRLKQLDNEIKQKQDARHLLAGLLGETSLSEWHDHLDDIAPEAHMKWLMTQGFNEKEALHLRWLSKDMNTHEKYMQDFMHIYATLNYWGPNDEKDTLKAFHLLPTKPEKIVEIGCGQGITTQVLAKFAHVTALDNDANALERLDNKAKQQGLESQIMTSCASMTDLPFDDASIDVIWAEGSAYIMGVENALKAWRKKLVEDGILVFSDLVWSTDSPCEQAKAFWQKAYPDICINKKRIHQAQKAGFRVLNSFPMSDKAWRNYYQPLSERVSELKKSWTDSAALTDIQREIDIVQRFGDDIAYHLFILQKDGK